jgi:hypothetical protein
MAGQYHLLSESVTKDISRLSGVTTGHNSEQPIDNLENVAPSQVDSATPESGNAFSNLEVQLDATEKIADPNSSPADRVAAAELLVKDLPADKSVQAGGYYLTKGTDGKVYMQVSPTEKVEFTPDNLDKIDNFVEAKADNRIEGLEKMVAPEPTPAPSFEDIRADHVREVDSAFGLSKFAYDAKGNVIGHQNESLPMLGEEQSSALASAVEVTGLEKQTLQNRLSNLAVNAKLLYELDKNPGENAREIDYLTKVINSEVNTLNKLGNGEDKVVDPGWVDHIIKTGNTDLEAKANNRIEVSEKVAPSQADSTNQKNVDNFSGLGKIEERFQDLVVEKMDTLSEIRNLQSELPRELFKKAPEILDEQGNLSEKFSQYAQSHSDNPIVQKIYDLHLNVEAYSDQMFDKSQELRTEVLSGLPEQSTQKEQLAYLHKVSELLLAGDAYGIDGSKAAADKVEGAAVQVERLQTVANQPGAMR